MDRIQYYDSPLGRLLLSSDGSGLSGLWFEGQKYYAANLNTDNIMTGDRYTESAAEWLNEYFSGRKPIDIPVLSLHGTDFRREVWDILLTIPYGKTVTYGEIARGIAERRGIAKLSARAVGSAVGHNPVSIIVPCHRVIGSDGSLTGYAGGIARKKYLLSLEGIE